jgi:hypothetical protein
LPGFAEAFAAFFEAADFFFAFAMR